MREYKYSTKRGKEIFNMGCKCCWSGLEDIYDSWSSAKQNAYDWCWNEYVNDENRSDFGIGNANTFGFTASWLLIKNNELCMRVETKDNSYLVWLKR